jgi:hypothetical protein
MVKPVMKLSEVRGLLGMVESGIRGEEEYKKSLLSFETFLRGYSTQSA